MDEGIEEFKQILAGAFEFRPISERIFKVHMPYIFRDGDLVALVVTRDDVNRVWRVNDGGQTYLNSPVDFNLEGDDFKGAVNSIKAFHGVTEVEGALQVEIPLGDKLGGLRVCWLAQCCVEIYNLMWRDH